MAVVPGPCLRYSKILSFKSIEIKNIELKKTVEIFQKFEYFFQVEITAFIMRTPLDARIGNISIRIQLVSTALGTYELQKPARSGDASEPVTVPINTGDDVDDMYYADENNLMVRKLLN